MKGDAYKAHYTGRSNFGGQRSRGRSSVVLQKVLVFGFRTHTVKASAYAYEARARNVLVLVGPSGPRIKRFHPFSVVPQCS